MLGQLLKEERIDDFGGWGLHKKKTVLKKQMLFTLGDSYSGWAPFGLEGRQMASNKLPTSHRDMNLLNL